MIFKKVIILLWFLYCVKGQTQEGDDCSTPTVPGICTSLDECPSVLDDIRHGKKDHVICGYVAIKKIVCCPNTPTTTTTENRISVRKCNDYKEFVYIKSYAENVIGTPPIEMKKSNCPFTKESLISGGTEAQKREFPHMASIGYGNIDDIAWICAGSLISEQFVLSAAHCFDTAEFGPPIYIRLGAHDLNSTDNSDRIQLKIIERILYPDYTYPMRYNDIGLFKLESEVKFNMAIRPLCLPEQSSVPTKTAIASGWGNMAWYGNRTNILMKVTLELFSQNECNSSYRIDRKLKRGIVEDIQVCAGSRTEKQDTCRGDSGGPLQIYHGSHHCTYTIVGITSFGQSCAIMGAGGVYTRVYAYLDWIESIVWPK